MNQDEGEKKRKDTKVEQLAMPQMIDNSCLMFS